MKKTLLAAGAMATLLGSVVLAQTVGTTTAEEQTVPVEMGDGLGMGMGMDMGPGMGGDMGMQGLMGGFGPLGADFATSDADGDGAITERGDTVSPTARARRGRNFTITAKGRPPKRCSTETASRSSVMCTTYPARGSASRQRRAVFSRRRMQAVR